MRRRPSISILVEHHFMTKISGVTRTDPHSKKSRQEIITKYVSAGTDLKLRREPRNPVDPNAVAVWLERRGCLGRKRFHLGYLNKKRAKEVAESLRAGGRAYAKVKNVTGGMEGRPTRGVNIQVWTRSGKK